MALSFLQSEPEHFRQMYGTFTEYARHLGDRCAEHIFEKRHYFGPALADAIGLMRAAIASVAFLIYHPCSSPNASMPIPYPCVEAVQDSVERLEKAVKNLGKWLAEVPVGLTSPLENGPETVKPREAPAEPAATQTEGETSRIQTPRLSVDFKALVANLRKQGKPLQAKLVEYMADKEEATAEEIAEHVHGEKQTSDSAMWNNADRTTKSLALLGSRLSFRFASGRMYREISPK
jgi:hypothetical protein